MKRSKFSEEQVDLRAAPGREWYPGWGRVPAAGGQRSHVLRVEAISPEHKRILASRREIAVRLSSLDHHLGSKSLLCVVRLREFLWEEDFAQGNDPKDRARHGSQESQHPVRDSVSQLNAQ